jgi:hypothetical protein
MAEGAPECTDAGIPLPTDTEAFSGHGRVLSKEGFQGQIEGSEAMKSELLDGMADLFWLLLQVPGRPGRLRQF